MKVLGIIPARGGSKRIPRKNLKPLKGIPLIQYTIDAAKSSKFLTRTIVSTDDLEIADYARSSRVDVPFLRPKEMAQDQSDDKAYILHALEWFIINEKQNFDAVVILRPTSPLRTSHIIDAAIEKYLTGKFSGLRTVNLIKGKGHPYWCFKSQGDLLKEFVDGININDYFQSQLLPDCYSINGLVDILNVKNLNSSTLYGDRISYLVTDTKCSADIDTLDDFDWCEFLMNRNH